MSRDRLALMKQQREREQAQGGGGGGGGAYPPQQAAYGQPQQQQSPPQPGYGGYNAQQGGQGGMGMGAGATMYPVGGSPQQLQGQGQYANQYEMQGVQGGQPIAGEMGMGMGATNGGFVDGPAAPALGPGNSMQEFFAEIELISQQLQTLKSHITQIAGLHNTILTSSTNEAKQEAAQRELDSLGSNTSRLTNDIKIRIKNMNDLNDRTPLIAGREGEKNTRRMQVAVQKKKFMDLIQEYREIEAKNRERYRARMERQYKIVKPDATPEEIRTAIDNDQAGGGQVFANALTTSTRYADARIAYREVQERHEDIKKISQTMLELQQLFNDMAMLVERQDEQIQTIEASAVDVETNMEGAHKQLEKGVTSARKARRKRWICFWILVLIVIALALGITLGILSKNGTI